MTELKRQRLLELHCRLATTREEMEDAIYMFGSDTDKAQITTDQYATRIIRLGTVWWGNTSFSHYNNTVQQFENEIDDADFTVPK